MILGFMSALRFLFKASGDYLRMAKEGDVDGNVLDGMEPITAGSASSSAKEAV